MADIQKYPTKDFSTQQTFLAYDPSQGTVRVSGQDIVDSIDLGTPIQLLQAEVNERVQYFRTTDLALLADLPISRVIYTTGASAENDGLGAHFVVVAAGTPNSLPMTNGNALAPVMQLMETISDAGTAATRDVMTSLTDTSTPDALMPRGAFGLGTIIPDSQVAGLASSRTGFFTNFANSTQRRIVLGRSSERAAYIEIDQGGGASLRLFAEHYDPSNIVTFTGRQELYHTGNILGTVSQSGGVPTGAVIQRGSNANGEFVRFADGTQICTSTSLTLSANSSSSMTGTFNFPISFFVQPDVTFKVTTASLNWSPSLPPLYGQFAEDGLSSSTLVMVLGGTSTVTTSGVRATAIGRWY